MAKTKRYIGKYPLSSRISINYRYAKPKVLFSYPTKPTKKNLNLFPTILFIWVLVNIIPTLVILEAWNNLDMKEEYNVSDYNEFVRYHTNETYLKEQWEKAKEKNPLKVLFLDVKKVFKKNFNWTQVIRELIVFFYLFLFPYFVVYLPFKKRWYALFAELNAIGAGKKKYKIFRTKDVQENREKETEWKYYCEIPLFNNILLDYEAKGDFFEYLKFFEIKEHDFKYMTKHDKVNDVLWYARFYFSKKPKHGNLKVIFK